MFSLAWGAGICLSMGCVVERKMPKSVCLHFLQWRNHTRPGRFLVNQDPVSLLSTWRGRAISGLLGRDGFHSRIRVGHEQGGLYDAF